MDLELWRIDRGVYGGLFPALLTDGLSSLQEAFLWASKRGPGSYVVASATGNVASLSIAPCAGVDPESVPVDRPGQPDFSIKDPFLPKTVEPPSQEVAHVSP